MKFYQLSFTVTATLTFFSTVGIQAAHAASFTPLGVLPGGDSHSNTGAVPHSDWHGSRGLQKASAECLKFLLILGFNLSAWR